VVSVPFVCYVLYTGKIEMKRQHVNTPEVKTETRYINDCKYNILEMGQVFNLSCVTGTVPCETRSCSENNHEVREPKTSFQITNKSFITTFREVNGQDTELKKKKCLHRS
jgi:hypothetical protein